MSGKTNIVVRRDKNNSDVDRNFIDVIATFNKLHLPYWCMNGTLLGVVRDGTLIPWDNDIDLAFEIQKIDINQVMAELEHLGFVGGINRRRRPGFPVLKYKRAGGRSVEILFFKCSQLETEPVICFEYHKTDDPNFRKDLKMQQLIVLKLLKQLGRLPIHEKELGIEFVRLKKSLLLKLIGFVSRIFPSQLASISKWLSSKYELDEVMGYYIPVSFFGEGVCLDYHGEKCRVPSQFTEVCKAIYGNDWKTPIKSSHWTEFLRR